MFQVSNHPAGTATQGICVISLETPRLTAANAPAFKDGINDLIVEGHKHFVVDLKLLSFLDSSGLGALVGLIKSVNAGSFVCVCNIHGVVKQLFEITHMNKVFQIHDNVEDALAWLQETA